MRVVLVGVLLAVVAVPAAAQLGNPPDESPYRDVRHRQEITPFGGWYFGNEGKAGVGPQAGPALGVRYELRIGGPVNFTARVMGVATERTVLDPEEEPEERVLGTERFPMVLADAGFTLLVTGRKTWHGIIPVVHGGAGIISALGQEVDEGGFRIGTPFALTIGTGVRYIPAGARWQVRVDLTDYLHKLNYPSAYFVPPDPGEPPITTGAQSEWVHNPTLTLGVSYLFGR